MKYEFFATSFDAIEANLYVGFSEAEGGEHYFILIPIFLENALKY